MTKKIILQFLNDQRTASNRARTQVLYDQTKSLTSQLQPVIDNMAGLLQASDNFVNLDAAAVEILQNINDNLDEILAVGEVQFRLTDTHFQYRIGNAGVWINITELSTITGDSPELRVDGGFIQWKLSQSVDWTNLIATSSLVGDAGPAIELQTSATHIQWRVAGAEAWNDLVTIDSLKGSDGDSAFVYIAYADDNTGTGFTMTPDVNKNYIAIKSTTTPIASPGAGDFTGLWKYYGGGGMSASTYDPAGGQKQVAFNDDSRFTDSREWTADTVAQAEAEARADTTRRAWTAQRVGQAITAWWTALTVEISKISGLQTALNGKEPVIAVKNTGFNKDFGTEAGTVAQGNDSRFSDARTPLAHNHVLSEVTDAGSVASINTNASTVNFLRGDGAWVTPPDTNTTYPEISNAEIEAGTANGLRTMTGRRAGHTINIARRVVITTKTAAWTFSLAEGDYYRYTGASNVNATIPPNSDQAYPIGKVITTRQAGNGAVTLVAGAGVTLTGDTKTAGQHKNISAVKLDTNLWDIVGGVA